MEEVEWNAREMRHRGFDDIAVRDDGDVLIGMPLAHAFEFADDSCLNVEHQFAIRNRSAAAQSVEPAPLRQLS